VVLCFFKLQNVLKRRKSCTLHKSCYLSRKLWQVCAYLESRILRIRHASACVPKRRWLSDTRREYEAVSSRGTVLQLAVLGLSCRAVCWVSYQLVLAPLITLYLLILSVTFYSGFRLPRYRASVTLISAAFATWKCSGTTDTLKLFEALFSVTRLTEIFEYIIQGGYEFLTRIQDVSKWFERFRSWLYSQVWWTEL
jgi:hypothetical protein